MSAPVGWGEPALDEARIREIVREELGAAHRTTTLDAIRQQLDDLLHKPSQLGHLGGQLDVPHEGEAVTTDDGDGLTRSWDARTFEYVETVKVVAS